jgi:hypothetical protein
LAKSRIHGVLVQHGRFLAREAGRSECFDKPFLHRREPVRVAGRHIGEDLAQIDRARQMSFGVHVRVAGIDPDHGLARHGGLQVGGFNQYAHSCLPGRNEDVSACAASMPTLKNEWNQT